MNIQYRQLCVASLLSVVIAFITPANAKMTAIVGPNGEKNIQESLSQKNILRAGSDNLFKVAQTDSNASASQLIGPTKKTDTLWSIATALSKVNGESVYQNIMAIYHSNPDAFEFANIHKLRPGSILRVPSPSQVKKESVAAARRKLELDRKKLNLKSTVVTKTKSKNTSIPSVASPAKMPKAQIAKQEQEKTSIDKLAAEIKESVKKTESKDELSLLNETNQLLRLRVSDMQHQIENLKEELNKNSSTEEELRHLLTEQRRLYENQLAAENQQAEEDQKEEAELSFVDIAMWAGVGLLAVILTVLVIFLLRRRREDDELPLNEIHDEFALDEDDEDDDLFVPIEEEGIFDTSLENETVSEVANNVSLKVDHQEDIQNLDTPPTKEENATDAALAAEWEASLNSSAADNNSSESDAALSDEDLAAEWEASLNKEGEEVPLPESADDDLFDANLAAEWEASLAEEAQDTTESSSGDDKGDELVNQGDLDALLASMEDDDLEDDGEKKRSDNLESDLSSEDEVSEDEVLDAEAAEDPEVIEALKEDAMLTDFVDDDATIFPDTSALEGDQLLSDFVDEELSDDPSKSNNLAEISELNEDQLLTDFIDDDEENLQDEDFPDSEAEEEVFAEPDLPEISAESEAEEEVFAEPDLPEISAESGAEEEVFAEPDLPEISAESGAEEEVFAEPDLPEISAESEAEEEVFAEPDLPETSADSGLEEDFSDLELPEESLKLELPENAFLPAEENEIPVEDIAEIDLDTIGEFGEEEALEAALAEEYEHKAYHEGLVSDDEELSDVPKAELLDHSDGELEMNALLDESVQPEYMGISDVNFDELNDTAGLDMEALLSESQTPLMSVAELEQQLAREEEQDILQASSFEDELVETDLDLDEDIWSESENEVPLADEDWASQPEVENHVDPISDEEIDAETESSVDIDEIAASIAQEEIETSGGDFISIDELMKEADDIDEDALSPDDIPIDLDVGLDEFPDVISDIEAVDVDINSESASQLDLAKVYIEMGDDVSAEELLSGLLINADDSTRSEANRLLDTLKNK